MNAQPTTAAAQTGEAAQEIASAAIEFVRLRLEAAELKDKRAESLRDSDCTNGLIAACFHQAWPVADWCARCRGAQGFHVDYRKTVARRTAALAKLKRAVLKHERGE